MNALMLLFEDTSRSVPVSSESRPSSFSSSATLSHRTRSSRPSAVSACCCSRRCSRHDWWSKARWGQCQPRGRRLLPLLPHAALLVGQLLLHPPQLLLQARAPPLLLGQLPLSRLAPAWNRAPRASASCSLRSSSCTLRPSRTSVCPASTAASPPPCRRLQRTPRPRPRSRGAAGPAAAARAPAPPLHCGPAAPSIACCKGTVSPFLLWVVEGSGGPVLGRQYGRRSGQSSTPKPSDRTFS